MQLFGKLFHLISFYFEVAVLPMICRDAHFSAELTEEVFRLGEFIPNLGQKGCPAVVLRNDHAVNARAKNSGAWPAAKTGRV